MTALLVGIVRGNYRDVDNHEVPEEAREVELVAVLDDVPRCAPESISDDWWRVLCDEYDVAPRERPVWPWLSQEVA